MLGHHHPNVEKSQLVYVEDYLECVESLPLDIQRSVSLLREIDTKYQEVLQEVDDVYERHQSESEGGRRKRLQVQLQRALITSQELGDEKIAVVTQMMELVENRSRQMDSHSRGLQEPAEAERCVVVERGARQQEAVMVTTTTVTPTTTPASADRSSARRPRRQQRSSESRDSSCHAVNGASEDPGDEMMIMPAAAAAASSQPRDNKRSKSAKKKKRSKAKQEREASPVEFNIDPNEPTYCLCEQVSYGEMIGCDNEQCPIEWFHFSCVGLAYKPKGKWYCPKCRGDSEKTMDRSQERNRKDRRSR